MPGKLPWIERDPDRQALNDLDPVAGRILCRDQCESRAGAPGKAHDPPVKKDFAPVEIAGELDRLARMDTGQLALLEVGLDIDRAHGNESHHRIAGCNALSNLHLAVGHDAIDRRPDDSS